MFVPIWPFNLNLQFNRLKSNTDRNIRILLDFRVNYRGLCTIKMSNGLKIISSKAAMDGKIDRFLTDKLKRISVFSLDTSKRVGIIRKEKQKISKYKWKSRWEKKLFIRWNHWANYQYALNVILARSYTPLSITWPQILNGIPTVENYSEIRQIQPVYRCPGYH